MSTRTERWSVELVLRYICATLVTWIAAAGAQLVVRTDFAVIIAILSFLGIPVSLYLRMHGMRILGVPLSRPLWNALTVVLFFVSAGVWTLISMSDLFGIMMSGGASQSFWLRFGAEGSLQLLMQVFLLFAAFRSFALISDKDATLATVPSFSVLLLLIPVHKGIEVVLYFLMWTLSATTLFALDHRAEMNSGADGRIPSPLPGQDVRMAARGLFTVLGAALIAAFSLSALLTSRNTEDRTNTESAITNLAGRLAQFAMSSSDSTLSGGPERQIDFSSGPALPSRALLWRVQVWKLEATQDSNLDANNLIVRPGYFRLFTLARYNGSTWTQLPREQKQVRLTDLEEDDWPSAYRGPFGAGFNTPGFGPGGGFGGGGFGGGRFGGSMPPNPAAPMPLTPGVRPGEGRMEGQGFAVRPSSPQSAPIPARPQAPQSPFGPYRGFPIRRAWSDSGRNFGSPTVPLRMRIRSYSNNVGFLPLLPNVSALVSGQGRPSELRTANDGAVDIGFVPADQRLGGICDVPQIADYGMTSALAPGKKVAATASSPQLSESDRRTYLELPPLSSRVQNLARQIVSRADDDEGNYGRARRLALSIQQGATYTLRPPSPPQGREATDFFLFDGNRRGYCTHFASALTVLCRSQGIPARIVSGFAAQEYSSDGWAQLREANAHAWTEIWIDNWGWAPIDATPSDDRGDNAPNVFAYWGDWFGFVFNQVEMWSRARVWLITTGVIVLLFAVYAFRRRARILAWWARRRGYLSNDDWTRREIMVAYDTAAARLAQLFRPREPYETPDEWLAAANAAALEAPRPRFFARQEFELLTEHYLRALYAPKIPEDSTVDVARNLARQVRRKKP